MRHVVTDVVAPPAFIKLILLAFEKHIDVAFLAKLSINVDPHGKMPVVPPRFTDKNRLLPVEPVPHYRPVNGKRHVDRAKLFAGATVGLAHVRASPTGR